MQIDLRGLGLGPRFCISIHPPGEADVLVHGLITLGVARMQQRALRTQPVSPTRSIKRVDCQSQFTTPFHYTIAPSNYK